MQVIQEGYIRASQEKCRGCGAILSFYKIDVKKLHEKLFITCPACGRGTVISQEDYNSMGVFMSFDVASTSDSTSTGVYKEDSDGEKDDSTSTED